MTTKHTPGPWITDSKERTDTARYIMAAARPFPHTIARIDLVNRAEDEANAALIAAAPELLAEAIADDGLAVFIERTLAAVALPSGHPEVSRAFGDIRGALASRGALRRAVIAKAEGRA